MVKTIWLVVSIGYTIFLAVLSFININDMPKLGSNFDDKIYHFGAYALLAFLWAFLIERFNTKKPLLIAAMGTIAYGIVIEVLQHKINPLRTFDTLDILANCLGVMFGIIIVNYLLNHKVKIN